MDNEFELDHVFFEDDEKKNVFIEQDPLESEQTISERWASWVNVINR